VREANFSCFMIDSHCSDLLYIEFVILTLEV